MGGPCANIQSVFPGNTIAIGSLPEIVIGPRIFSTASIAVSMGGLDCCICAYRFSL